MCPSWTEGKLCLEVCFAVNPEAATGKCSADEGKEKRTTREQKMVKQAEDESRQNEEDPVGHLRQAVGWSLCGCISLRLS